MGEFRDESALHGRSWVAITRRFQVTFIPGCLPNSRASILLSRMVFWSEGSHQYGDAVETILQKYELEKERKPNRIRLFKIHQKTSLDTIDVNRS